MRFFLLAFTALVCWSQTLPEPSKKLQQALPPVEQWLGAPLVIYEDTILVQQSDFGEASLWNHGIYVPLSRMRSFRNLTEAAAFLSHAAAHNKLHHASLYAEKVQLYAQLVILSPHFPQATIASMEANLRADLEKEAEVVAAEFLAKSDSGRLRRLLDAVR